ncbi:MAG TPA: hypothetical protein VL728_01025 [Cyclobacteriaceae bacterium]|nr:hypothetical protein [Cyclobacteriaceae bacterium]
MKVFWVATLFLFTFISCHKKKQPVENNREAVAFPEATKQTAIIYRSSDGGKNWTPFDNGIPRDATVSLFLVLGDKILTTTDYHGIYSIDQGEKQWKRIDQNLPKDADLNAIAKSGNTLVIATLKHGILISSDEGATWVSAVTKINSSVRALHANAGFLLAGADDGIYKSTDKGSTWKKVFNGPQVNGFAQRNKSIYAGLSNGAIHSNDDGGTWKYIYQPHAMHDIAADNNAVYVMTLGDGLKKSENEGLTWEVINSGLGTLNLYTFELKAFANKIFVAQWYGIYSSSNSGASWNKISNGLPDSTAFSTLEVTKDGLIAGVGLRKKND